MEKHDDSAGCRHFGYLHFFLFHVNHSQNIKNNIIFAQHVVTIELIFSLSDKAATETRYLKQTVSIMKLLFLENLI